MDDTTRTQRDQAARRELAADEARITGSRRNSISLGGALAEFVRHPSPWMLATLVAAAATARVARGDWGPSDLVTPVILLLALPVVEWLIHVFVLHWRPRTVAGLRIDSELARDHRLHHADPRALPLVFIPWRSLAGIITVSGGLALLLIPDPDVALVLIASAAAIASVYEWMHYLMHTDYRPRSRVYRSIWRNHRLHHYKNENYWFTVTTAGTADRLFGTCPDPATVPTSPTARNLHGTAD